MNQAKPRLGIDACLQEQVPDFEGQASFNRMGFNQLADNFDLCWLPPGMAPDLAELAGVIFANPSADSRREYTPLVPMEELVGLNDRERRENFFERVYAYNRWQLMLANQGDCRAFIEFHMRHKLMLMARGQVYYRELGRTVAGVRSNTLTDRRLAYIAMFMRIMALPSKRGGHINVLQHILGYFKQQLSGDEKRLLLADFEAYRHQRLSLDMVLGLIRNLLQRFPQDYIADQHYLEPYPRALRAYRSQ